MYAPEPHDSSLPSAPTKSMRVLATGAEVAGPLLIKLFIDDYLAPRQLVWPDTAR